MGYTGHFYGGYLVEHIFQEELKEQLSNRGALFGKDVEMEMSGGAKTHVTFKGCSPQYVARQLARFGREVHVLELLDCGAIEDFSFMKDCPNVQLVNIMWNRKAKQLWAPEVTPKLRHLSLFNFTQMKQLDSVGTFSQLEELTLNSRLDGQWCVDTLKPLQGMSNLRYLWCFRVKPEEQQYWPLIRLSYLKVLHFDTSIFEITDFARLSAALPHTRSNFQTALIHYEEIPPELLQFIREGWQQNKASQNFHVVGKGQRLICVRATDSEKTVKKKIEKIRLLVQTYEETKRAFRESANGAEVLEKKRLGE